MLAPGFAFRDTGIDRAAERRDDEAWLDAARARPDARLLAVRSDGQLPVGADGGLAWRHPSALPGDAPVAFLGLDAAGRALFAAALDADAAAALHAGRWADLRSLAPLLTASDAGAGAYARALLHWQSRKRFCGRCGAPTRPSAAGHRASCSDAACGQQYFPRTDPAVITLVHAGRRCLLGRQPSWPERRYSTLAGFVEPGESLEAAVQREVEEEVGLRIGSARYVASQPWPFPASLMLGFEAVAETTAIRLGSELCDARWFEADAMPALIAAGELVLPPALSISFFLIDRWFAGVTGARLTPGPVLTTR